MLEDRVPLGESRAGDATRAQIGSRDGGDGDLPIMEVPQGWPEAQNSSTQEGVQAGSGSEFLLLCAHKPER